MSAQTQATETNTPRVDLRSIDTDILKRELRARERCCQCGAENARGWKTAGRNRVICVECAPAGAAEARS